jgi:hypothetical protein
VHRLSRALFLFGNSLFVHARLTIFYELCVRRDKISVCTMLQVVKRYESPHAEIVSYLLITCSLFSAFENCHKDSLSPL